MSNVIDVKLLVQTKAINQFAILLLNLFEIKIGKKNSYKISVEIKTYLVTVRCKCSDLTDTM